MPDTSATESGAPACPAPLPVTPPAEHSGESGRPTYTRLEMDLPRPGWPLRFTTCDDCGAIVYSERTHDRFHAILNDHAKAIAVLIGTHLSESCHDRYDVTERIGKTSGGWSGEAFEAVTGIAPSGRDTKPTGEAE